MNNLTKKISACAASILISVAGVAAKKPNVIVILIDDMGWSDSSTYGSTFYQTPNMTRLAEEGMLFTDGYAASPLCSPTRASIMSGQYPARLHMTVAVTPKSQANPKRPPLPRAQISGKEKGRNTCPWEWKSWEKAYRIPGMVTPITGKGKNGKTQRLNPSHL